MTIAIDNREIGRAYPPFVIAEISGNHNQSLERALEIVRAAAKARVGAIKLQTYTADTMTLDLESDEFMIKDANNLWHGTSLYKLYQRASTPWEWHKKIFDECRKQGIVGFSTPFDTTAVDFLESLNVPCYKIASFENIDIPLIKRIAATGKPVIISTGMATEQELLETIEALRASGCKDIVMLKCTSSYPADPKESNLVTIPDMRKRFNCEVGISDHTLGIGAALAGIVLGATVIEKHITLSRSEGGVDSAFSVEPDEMKMLVEEAQRAWQSLGNVKYGPTENEKKSLVFRRSIYVVKGIRKGDRLSKENIRSIRPGLGLAPKYYEQLIGKRVKWDLVKGTPLKWEMIENE